VIILFDVRGRTRFSGSVSMTVKGDSKGGKPLAYWGIFSSSETDA